jgi:hypothetical protein
VLKIVKSSSFLAELQLAKALFSSICAVYEILEAYFIFVFTPGMRKDRIRLDFVADVFHKAELVVP